MNNWFEVKAAYEKAAANGDMKRVTEPYLVDALSFTEAEARIIKELSPIYSSMTVVAIKREKISEIFEDNISGGWFKAKVSFLTINEKSGDEKKTTVNMFIEACDITEAKANFEKGMKGTMADYTLESLADTKIVDIFKYLVEGPDNNESEV